MPRRTGGRLGGGGARRDGGGGGGARRYDVGASGSLPAPGDERCPLLRLPRMGGAGAGEYERPAAGEYERPAAGEYERPAAGE